MRPESRDPRFDPGLEHVRGVSIAGRGRHSCVTRPQNPPASSEVGTSCVGPRFTCQCVFREAWVGTCSLSPI